MHGHMCFGVISYFTCSSQTPPAEVFAFSLFFSFERLHVQSALFRPKTLKNSLLTLINGEQKHFLTVHPFLSTNVAYYTVAKSSVLPNKLLIVVKCDVAAPTNFFATESQKQCFSRRQASSKTVLFDLCFFDSAAKSKLRTSHSKR